MKKNPQEFSKISFFVVAHTDDWQLFMHPNVYNELLEPGRKVVFIITTSGDAGMSERFWRSREEGHKSSVRFCLAPVADLFESSGFKKVDGQTIHYWLLNNTTTYFLRLPDGGLNGGGFPGNNHQSLQRLKDGQIRMINAVDNSAGYKSWQHLLNTVAAITNFESSNIQQISMHYLNPDSVANSNDHPDHGYTGQLIQPIAAVQNMDQLLYVGYSTSNNLSQLSVPGLFWKTGMLTAYEKAVFDGSGYSTLRENPGLYIQWCSGAANFITLEAALV